MARSVFQVPGKWGLTLMSMQAIQIAVPTTAIFMAPAIAGLSVHIFYVKKKKTYNLYDMIVLLGPLAIVGVVNLLWSGI